MTTTYDHQRFYAELREAVQESISKKIAIYTSLSDKNEMVQRKDAIIDILSIFSLSENVTEVDEDMESASIEKNIQLIVSDYYSFVGNDTIVGTTAEDVLLKELDDLAIMILAKFPSEFFTEFNKNLPLSKFEQTCIENADDINQVEIAILTVIKSEIMLLDLALTKKPKATQGANIVT